MIISILTVGGCGGGGVGEKTTNNSPLKIYWRTMPPPLYTFFPFCPL